MSVRVCVSDAENDDDDDKIPGIVTSAFGANLNLFGKWFNICSSLSGFQNSPDKPERACVYLEMNQYYSTENGKSTIAPFQTHARFREIRFEFDLFVRLWRNALEPLDRWLTSAYLAHANNSQIEIIFDVNCENCVLPLVVPPPSRCNEC